MAKEPDAKRSYKGTEHNTRSAASVAYVNGEVAVSIDGLLLAINLLYASIPRCLVHRGNVRGT